jgi:phosphate transport system protein
VEERVQMAIKAIDTNDSDLAQKIIKTDYEIDEVEVEIEEECLKVLALHQPMAIDLRFIVAVIKINAELERIGDEAVNIAERVEVTAKREQLDFYFDYSSMGEKAQAMLKMSLDALIHLDYDRAFEVVIMDDQVDKIKREAYDKIKKAMGDNPDKIGYLINLFLISRHLERLADHATNIAEQVVYLVEGEIIRHAPYTQEPKKQ